MGMYAQSDVGFQHGAGITALATTLVSSAPVAEAATLRSAVRLLTEADRALAGSNDNVRRYIVRAAALLQTEVDSRDYHGDNPGGATRSRLAPWQVTRVMQFVSANLGKKIGPHDFAGLTRLSTSHFARAFRATIGEAPYAYLIRCRIQRAKELMLETDLPLVQIALDCGLADQAHMTRLFTRLVGVSPGAWRRAHVAAGDIAHAANAYPPEELDRKQAL